MLYVISYRSHGYVEVTQNDYVDGRRIGIRVPNHKFDKTRTILEQSAGFTALRPQLKPGYQKPCGHLRYRPSGTGLLYATAEMGQGVDPYFPVWLYLPDSDEPSLLCDHDEMDDWVDTMLSSDLDVTYPSVSPERRRLRAE